jgi:hypothetical protein
MVRGGGTPFSTPSSVTTNTPTGVSSMRAVSRDPASGQSPDHLLID